MLIYVQFSFPSSLMRGLHFWPLAIKQGSVIGLARGLRMRVTIHFTASMALSVFSSPATWTRRAKCCGWYNYRMVKPPSALPCRSPGGSCQREWWPTPGSRVIDQTINMCEATEICGLKPLQHDPALLIHKPAYKSHSEGARDWVLIGEWEREEPGDEVRKDHQNREEGTAKVERVAATW